MKTLLETHSLTIQIANHVLCNHLTFQIQAGEIWGILGPNGSGKTTLLQTLAALLPASNGTITLQGKPITSLSRQTIARHLGILFQDSPDVFSQSVYEFCRSGRYPHLNYFSWNHSADTSIIQQALLDVELRDIAQQKVATLSGGEKRRLNIATLLTQSPRLYLLDEPTNHLDLRYQIKILNHFQTLARTTSIGVLMSLHDINLAAHYCHKIIMLLGNGKFLAGPTAEILTTNNLEQLYQQPLQKLVHDNSFTAWLPKFEN